MKKYIVVTFLVMCMSFSVANAQTKPFASKDEIEYSILKDQYQKLLDKQVVIENERKQMIEDLKSERENYLNFMELIISICAGILILLGTFATFMGWKTRKDIEQKISESLQKERDRLEEGAKEKLQNYSNKLILDVSRLINQNPNSLKEVIDKKISDYDARQNNTICLYHTSGDRIDELLNSYDFKIVENYEIKKEQSSMKFCSYKNASVIFITDPNSQKDEIKSFCDKLKEQVQKEANYFYLGKGRFSAEVHLSNFASTPITVEHNLMDLLKYIEFERSSGNNI